MFKFHYVLYAVIVLFFVHSRFLLDAPESEIGNPIYLCFLTELAYWFYLDEYAEEDEKLNNLKFDAFAQQLLNVRTTKYIISCSSGRFCFVCLRNMSERGGLD